MNRRIALCFLFSVLLFSVQAQRTIKPENFLKGTYFNLGFSTTYGKVQDQVISPLYYTYTTNGVNNEYLWYGTKHAFSANSNIQLGKSMLFLDDVTLLATQNNFLLDFKYNYLLPVGYLSEGLRLLPGASLDNSAAIRTNPHLGNAANSFDFISSLSANFGIEFSYSKAEKKRKLFGFIPHTRKQKDYTLFANIKLPLVSYYMRPTYTNPGNTTITDNGFLEGYKMKWGALKGLSTEIGFGKSLKNGNMIKYSYMWNISSIGENGINKLNDAKHTLKIGFLFKVK